MKTAQGERPTPTSEPFRGTIAFFNPASFFAVAGTEYLTIREAREAGDEHLICKDFMEMAKILPTSL